MGGPQFDGELGTQGPQFGPKPLKGGPPWKLGPGGGGPQLLGVPQGPGGPPCMPMGIMGPLGPGPPIIGPLGPFGPGPMLPPDMLEGGRPQGPGVEEPELPAGLPTKPPWEPEGGPQGTRLEGVCGGGPGLGPGNEFPGNPGVPGPGREGVPGPGGVVNCELGPPASGPLSTGPAKCPFQLGTGSSSVTPCKAGCSQSRGSFMSGLN